ncbi:caspase family protein [Reichenbachiella sp. 5M10]|uniref:caspase family protein n=1 Tax=Reichenbachiella sp. 5M10 TaxID=1889772 RepID=UPI001303F5C2|nr:caspase family protein [Reichenbachiella sp. 5M10]
MIRTLVLVFMVSVQQAWGQDLEMRTVFQRGHEAPIIAAAFNPGGELLATGSEDQTVILWEVATGRQLRTFSGHSRAVTTLDFHPKDEKIATAGDDKSLIVWDYMTGEKVQEFNFDYWVSSIRFSPDGSKILVGGGSHTVQLIDLATSQVLQDFKVQKTQYGVLVAFGATGVEVITGNDDGKVIRYGVLDGEPTDTLRNISASSCGGCLTYLDIRESELASVAHSGAVSLWDLMNGELLESYGNIDNDYEDVALSQKYVFASDEKQVVQWRKDGVQVRVFGQSSEDLTGIAMSPDGQSLLTYGEDQVAKLWDVETGTVLQEYRGYLNMENDRGLSFGKNSYWHSNLNQYLSIRNKVLISPDGKKVIKGHYNSSAFLWDTHSGRSQLELKGHDKIVVDYVFAPNSKHVFTAGGDRVVRLWDVDSGEMLRVFEGHRDLVFELVLSENGRYLASGSWDGTAMVWDVETGALMHTYRFDNSSPFTMAFAYHDQYLLVGGLDKKLCLVELDTGEPFVQYIGHRDIVTDIEIRDEEILTASKDGLIKLWELKTGFQKKRLAGHEGPVYDVSYDTHGLYIASGGQDKSVRLWDAETGKERRTFVGHKGAVTGVQFINDDRVLVSSSLDGTMRYWDVESGKEIAMHVFLGARDWLTKSSRGYFDATEAARENVFFVEGVKSYALDQFFEEFYRPDILEQSLQLGADVHYDSDLKQKLLDSPPPTVEIVSPKPGERPTSKEIDVVIKLTNQGGGVDELRLLHNGKRVMGNERGLMDADTHGKSLYKHVSIGLVPGKNVISVSGFSEERIESQIIEREVMYEGIVDQITCHVVAIGINTYKNPILNLNYAKEDAEGFVDLIKKKGKNLYDDLKLYPLYNTEASKENIYKVLDEVARQAKPEDVLLVYYAGHGSTVDGDFYFIPTENVRLYDQKKLKEHAIHAGDMQVKLAHIAALKQMVVIDACQSGSSTQLLASRGAEEEKAMAQLSRSTGVHILAASGSEQYATEFAELGHGLFTYVLLEALSGSADGAPADGKVTIYELKSYLDDQVPEYSSKYKGRPQYPVTYSRGQDFPIVVE